MKIRKKHKWTPSCEHCGQLEIGSFAVYDGGTDWCLSCAEANLDEGESLPEPIDKLYTEQRYSQIEAHQKRILHLEKELDNEEMEH